MQQIEQKCGDNAEKINMIMIELQQMYYNMILDMLRSEDNEHQWWERKKRAA